MMETNKAYLLKKNFITISGEDTLDFLQNIISNDIKKVNDNNSIYSALLTPQGKLLFEFIILKRKQCYFLECNNEDTNELFNKLNSYKLRSKINIEINFNLKSLDFPYIIFKNLNVNKHNLINYKGNIIFDEPRIKNSFSRLVCEKEKIKDLLNEFKIFLIDDDSSFNKRIFDLGIPSKDIKKLQGQIFALEANLYELNGIDYKKGCYVGQENTARMSLKNKINKRLLPINILNGKIFENQKITLNNEDIGKILIDNKYPFALIKINNENKNNIKNKDLKTDTATFKVEIPNWLVI